ncbi:MAG: DNA polymerase I [Legionella sp.]
MVKPIVLVDGSSYFFRAFHALPALTTSKGQATGAIYGVVNMIKRLIKDYQPEKMAIVFDAKGKTFRDEWYPAYKANRTKMPPELSSQFEPLIAILTAMGLPLLIIEGVEADDVIGTLAKQATERAIPVIISTGDKDMTQLVNEHVTLINTMTNQILDIDGVITKFGVSPAQMIDYLALVGDSSDNIPGVEKCGPKTAVKWLKDYQNIDTIIENAASITGKLGENLRAGIAQLMLSKKLVTIVTDVKLPSNIDELKPKASNHEQLIALTREFEFKNWLKELLDESPAQLAAESLKPTIDVHIVTSRQELIALTEQLDSSQEFYFTIKTAGQDLIDSELIGLAFRSSMDQRTNYVHLRNTNDITNLDCAEILTIVKPILENPNLKKIGHNLKNCYQIFKNIDITIQGLAFDTMLESYVVNSTATRHDLPAIALKYLGYHLVEGNELSGIDKAPFISEQKSIDSIAFHLAEEIHVIRLLHQKLYTMMAASQHQVFHDIEMPLLTILAEMEHHGVLIDSNILEQHGKRLNQTLLKLEEESEQITGKKFNINSPKQLQDILFNQLGLPVITKTPTGQASTAESVLQELAFDYRLPALILEYRSLSKLVSTYIHALPKRINSKTGRVHSSYNQAITATGRLSSSEPNLQNIPIRNEEGRLIRSAFVAPNQSVIISADYSQIELRIMAHLSQDPALISAFALGLDIHTATASEIFATALNRVTAEQRRRAKAVNFGLIYGMSSFGLAKQIGVDRHEAQNYIDRYFQRYPGVLAYMDETRKKAHQQGYVETVFGRRLHLPEINTRNMMRQKAAERTAINAPMQGTAADIIKMAMIAFANWATTQEENTIKMIMQVHDELVFEVDKAALTSAKKTIQKLMEQVVELSVPLIVSIGSGDSWDKAH